MLLINKNIKRKFALTFFIVLSSVICFSQTPGYLGKRFAGGYGLYASSGFIGSHGLIKINTHHEFFLEYAVKKRFMIGFSATLYRPISSNSREVTPDIYTAYGLKQTDTHPTDVMRIEGRNYKMYFKFFRKNSLAPWGKYFILGATLNTYLASYDSDKMYIRTYAHQVFDNTYIYYSDFGPTKQHFVKFDILFGKGRTHMLTDRVSPDYGYNINVVALTLSIANYNEEGIYDTNGTILQSDYTETTSLKTIRGVNGFNVYCKAESLIY